MLTPTFGWRSDDDEGPTKQRLKAAGAKAAGLKAQLKTMLAQPLIARGVSTRYITSGVRSIADDMIAGECTLLPSFHSDVSSRKNDCVRLTGGLPHGDSIAHVCYFGDVSSRSQMPSLWNE